MNDIIHLLPDSVANQIAAGEVVQRPSSIIKEMVENSIDADATSVKVLVTDGGKTTVQVIDDGKGMSETDARLSFERHATSKIQKASDLFCLTTMGFRGEALASIAAVAQVELKTRRKEDELGTMIQVAGSKIEKQEPVACPAGSNFLVQNLFFNVPARRKFLKSNQTELTNVVADFQRIVLVHPEISFSLYNNGVEMFHLPAASVRQRIIDVFGKKINIKALHEYMIAVGKNTRHILENITLEQIKSMVPYERVMRILEEGGVTTDFRSVWLLVYWGSLTMGGMILTPMTDHHMMHLPPCLNNLPILEE